MAVLSDDMGGITAYAAAVNRGYTGTKEEFEQLMYSYTEVAERAEAAAGNAHESEEATIEAKDIAVSAKNEAVSARDASQSARDASVSAKNDSESARDSAISAKNDTLAAKDAVIDAKSDVDETSANFSEEVTAAISDVNAAGRNQKELAKTHAIDSEAWAVGQREGADVGVSDETYHNNSKYYAEQSALAKSETETARDTAITAKNDAVSAKNEAETAKGEAQDIVDGINAKSEQIDQNTSDISELKEDLSQISPIADEVNRGFVKCESDNLFIQDEVIDGYVTADGEWHDSASYVVSGFMPVNKDDVITFYIFGYTKSSVTRTAISCRFLAAYDADKNPVSVSGSASTISTYTVPDGIKYIRCSFAVSFFTAYGRKLYVSKNSVPIGYTVGFRPKLVPQAQAGRHYYNAKWKSSLYADGTLEIPTMSLCKNAVISFSGYVTNINSNDFVVSIGQGSNHFGATWVEIDAENLYWHIYTTSDSVLTYAHGLPFDSVTSGYLTISLITNDNAKAVLKIEYGETECKKTLGFYGFSDQPYFFRPTGITIDMASFSVTCRDFDAPVFVFGDSYIAIIESTAKWTNYYVADGFGDNICVNAFPGANSAELANAFKNTLAIATPQKILWCLGMNDGSDTDATTPNAQWLEHVTNMLNVCKAKNIEPLFLTIPTVPSVNNEAKNAWIRASQYRFADAAAAVGADGTGAWFDGMLSTDNVHPTALGAKAIYNRIISDLPDLFV